MNHKIFEIDPRLKTFEAEFDLRRESLRKTQKALLQKGQKLADFANGHQYFGFHQEANGWYYREWAPGADEVEK